MNNNFFSTQMSKLRLEALVRSLLSGLAVGFGVSFALALVFWFGAIGNFWILLGVLAFVTVVAGMLFYFCRFIPTDVRSARRLDSLGLYERMVTMVEYQNDDSYMAHVQREDAKKKLASIDKSQIKIKISKAILVSSVVFAILGTSMITVNALSDYDIIPNGNELINSLMKEATKVYYSVTYVAEEGGIIEGDEDQLVEGGTDAETVTAVADEGYAFTRWSDGLTTPTRTDTAVSADATYYAEFEKVEDPGDGEDEGDGDEPTDAPPQDGDGEQQPGESGDPNPDAVEGGGKYQPNNQIIDGVTFYRDIIKLYQETANERIIDENSTLTDAEKEIIKKYLGIV